MSLHNAKKPTDGAHMWRVTEPPDPNDHLLERILSRENMRKAWKRGVAIPMSLTRKGPWRSARTMATQTGMIRLRRTQGSRSGICQRTVGENTLPAYGPVSSVNRLVRRGGC